MESSTMARTAFAVLSGEMKRGMFCSASNFRVGRRCSGKPPVPNINGCLTSLNLLNKPAGSIIIGSCRENTVSISIEDPLPSPAKHWGMLARAGSVDRVFYIRNWRQFLFNLINCGVAVIPGAKRPCFSNSRP